MKLQLDNFSKNDMDDVLEALDSWADSDAEFLMMIEALKSIKDLGPAANHEAQEEFDKLKTGLFSQEKKAKDKRRIRREKTIILKAKLLLVMQQIAADELFKDAQ